MSPTPGRRVTITPGRLSPTPWRLAPTPWRLALACILCVTPMLSHAAPNQKDVIQLRVFSSLQKSQSEEMPPYPVGMDLSLTCQAPGNRKTFWYEKTEANVPEALQSENGSHLGVHWSVYNINRLDKDDHGRELMCLMDSSTMHKDVKLNVIDQPVPADISTSIDPEVNANLQCVVEGLSSQLELCWHEGNETLVCKVSNITSPSTTTSVTTQVPLPDLLGKNRTFLCQPRLRSEVNSDTLTDATKRQFDAMFAKVSKEMKMATKGPVDCDATPEPGTKDIRVVKSEDNANTCFLVTISEHDVVLPGPKVTIPDDKNPEPKGTTTVPSKQPTTATPGEVAANSDNSGKNAAVTTVSALTMTSPLPIAAVLMLAPALL